MRDYAIILAADLTTAEEVVQVVKQVGRVVDGIKIGVTTLLESGVGILGRIRDAIDDRPLLVDLKIADIGFQGTTGWQGTNGKIVKGLADSGATHVTVHGFPGAVSIAEAVHTARDWNMGVLLLPLMSHAGASLFFSRPLESRDLSTGAEKSGLSLRLPDALPCNDVTDGILHLGEALDVAGYIGPATRPHDLERYRTITRKPIWCPGFGRQDRMGRTLEEQFRQWSHIVGPASAAIVGSAVFGAPDRVAAAREIAELRDKVAAEGTH
ncbi:MAG: orotidine 5'-phosphate decarboxylase / HUMPS family protein [Desulfomonilaceae bacterium]|nr:orotidine 5'-phosphate decarboxylase / HUMPS family protein [Desulfomonilaceae bacterium]